MRACDDLSRSEPLEGVRRESVLVGSCSFFVAKQLIAVTRGYLGSELLVEVVEARQGEGETITTNSLGTERTTK